MKVRWRVVLFWIALFALIYKWPTEGAVKEITLDILPRIVLTNPYKRAHFTALIRIEEHPDNRLYSFAGDCGGDAVSWTREIDFVAKTFDVELVVVDECLFVACVHRLEKGKIKPYCTTVRIEGKNQGGKK